MKTASSRAISIPLTAVLYGQLSDRAADPAAANPATVARAGIIRGLANPLLPMDDVARSDRRMAHRRVTVRLDPATIRAAQDVVFRDKCSLAHALRVALARGLGPVRASAAEIASVIRMLDGKL